MSDITDRISRLELEYANSPTSDLLKDVPQTLREASISLILKINAKC